jgi:hypothetical protein
MIEATLHGIVGVPRASTSLRCWRRPAPGNRPAEPWSRRCRSK